ncbi:sugar phosphate isomerase/epimerase family protein [Manganibacter manganicus]|uniref:Xylose isomerase n=1 Tax=Manganibacter manganicus TaxID=1873176 RepID=A0A1V8RMI7_9HYPH|nr:sugar phosphate isomerase/epimerase family protein [Pseudaminobacter manganicus]OQM74189.1 xylose isomerase [Pseudaminobacter manganicus]
MANTFGLHTFAIAPVWDIARIEPQMEQLKAQGIGLLEIPLLRPSEIDTGAARSFADRHDIELIASLGLPATIDVIEQPQDGLAFLEPAFRVCAEIGSFGLAGVTYATLGKTTGRAPTQREIDGTCRFLEKAAALAKSYKLKLGIEPCNRYETHLINTGEAAANIIRRTGADNIFIHLDTYHMHIEEESFSSGFEAAAPFLGYLHVSEANRGVPGQGMLNWAACMNALANIDYRGPVTLESMNHVDVDIAGALAIWRPVAKRPADVVEVGLPFLRDIAHQAGILLG